MEAKLFGLIIFSACVTTLLVTATVVTPPRDVTVKKGDNAEFRCDTSSPDEVVQWTRFLPRTEIIAVTGRQFNYSGKYQVVNNSVLIISNVTASDGLPYACLAVLDETQLHYANLVVIENFTATVTSANITTFDIPTTTVTPENVTTSRNSTAAVTPVMRADGITSDKNVTLTCVLRYGGPRKDNSIYPLSPDQELQLSIYFGDEDLTPFAIAEQRSGSDLQPINTNTLSVNRVVTLGDIDKEVRCRVRSVRPFYEDYFNMTLPFKHSATMVTISTGFNGTISGGFNGTGDMQLQAGTLLNCSANGNPAPQVKWQPGDRNTAYEVVLSAPGYSVLRVVGVGENQWNCTASNAISGKPQAFQVINFTVIGVPPNVSQSSIALGIGLGVGLGILILIGIIVVICLLRKHKYTGYHRPAKNQKKPSPIYNKTSPTFGTGSLSPPKIQPPPSKVLKSTNYNGLAMNANPAHDTSRTSETSAAAPPSRGSHSPGHGDLGVRTLGASGSMPRLNESFDSAEERNYNGNPGTLNYPPMDTSYHSSQRVRNQPSMNMSYEIDLSAQKVSPMVPSHQNNHFFPKHPQSVPKEAHNTSV